MQSARADILQALTELEVEYWHEVDRNWGRQAHRFYVEDGVFAIGDKTMVGRDAIAGFYRWREGRGERTARHLVSNFRLGSADGRRVEFECVMCLYAADGAPVLESRPAIMIADVVSACVVTNDGQWRYALHRLKPIFMGGEAPTIPP
jgi:SnoaL-like domain